MAVLRNVLFLVGFRIAIAFVIHGDQKNSTNAIQQNFSDFNLISEEDLMVSCDQCGLENRHRIVGGRDALSSEFPWLIIIKYWKVRFCSGSLINAYYVLTAAHCVERKFSQLLSVVRHKNSFFDKTSEENHQVDKIILHSNFDPKTFDYDIALLRLKQKVNFDLFTRPVCLPTGFQNFTHHNATVVGWGAVLEDEEFVFGLENRLNKLDVPVVSNDECKASPGLHSYLISNRMLCAGYIEGGKDACQGDSGGPLLIKSEGRWTQIGIVSWGIGCARPEHYGVYTRLAEFLAWISLNLDNLWTC